MYIQYRREGLNQMKTVKHVIVNKDGLVGDNANKFVNKCSSFKSSITISVGDKTVNAKSILAVLYLRAIQFDSIEITICGTDEELAQDVIKNYLKDNI